MRSLCLTLWCCCFFAIVVHGQDNGSGSGYADDTMVTTSGEDQDDTSRVSDILGDTTLYIHPIVLGEDSFNRWKREEGFAYMARIDSLLQAKKAGQPKESQTPQTKGPSGSWLTHLLGSGFVQALLWVLAGIFVLFIIYRLFLNKGVLVKNARLDKVTEETQPEEIHEADFRQLIRQATAQADFRKAVRYQYLHSLQRLSEKGLIQLSADKTDGAYVREVPLALRPSFASLTRMYEYVWFGRQQVSETTYRQLEKEFSAFNG